MSYHTEQSSIHGRIKADNINILMEARFDGKSELVAELVTVNGFKAAYAIKDGAEGTRGWMKSGLPWLEPKKTLTLDFGDLKDAVTSGFGQFTLLMIYVQDGSDGLPIALGLAAAAGLGIFAFTEVETLLQALLPADTNVKASLPAPTDASAAPAPTQKTDAVTSTEPLPAVNSVPIAEVKEELPRVTPRPLSPYPYYPDLKPPSSPSPSQP
ncbi:hypothetical protein B296_00030387 [Ensete ventricosum]|uniref:Uncharacterized protein n=1 Tax=Ensete ventricosum TaxID=4639 RepID=A0A426ZAT4_ENSVE|nr:hypothetical protein B296_00030387 [Ensete ventricosum]